MFTKRTLLLFAFSIFACAAEGASPDHGHAHHGTVENRQDHPNLWTGEGIGIGGVLFPSVNFTTAFGASTADDPASLAVGHHDPDRDGWTIQNVEFSLEARLGEHVRAFALYAAKIDLDDHWDDHFEEYYLTVEKLPGDLRLRAGRFYTVFGFQNNRHPHEFDWADQYLMNGRFIGDDPLTVYGGEVSLPLPWSMPAGWSDRLTFSMGAVPDAEEHEHAHGHGEGEEEPEFEPEGALLQDWLANVNYTARYEYSENHRFTAGVSAAFGENNFERNTQIYGVHLEYRWSENGPGDDGRWFAWRTEFALRRFGARSSGELHLHEEEEDGHAAEDGSEAEHGEEGHGEDEDHDTHEGEEHDAEPEPEPGRSRRRDFTGVGFYTTLMYGWNQSVALQARAEWVSGTDEAGLDERLRLSPGITWRPTERLDLLVRAQYNFDHSSAFGDEHSVWTQFVIGWGGGHQHEH
jgi:hypothetical protein